MTRNEPTCPADLRLLDAALRQVFAPAAAAPTVAGVRRLANDTDRAAHELRRAHRAERSAPGAPAPQRRWLAAALVVLGAAVTTAIAVGVRGDALPAATLQEPAPLPPEVHATGPAQLAELPADTANLAASLTAPEDLGAVQRFPSLRRLRLHAEAFALGSIRTRLHHVDWAKPPANLLQPLARVRSLECLELPSRLALSAELLAPLAALPALRELHLGGADLALDDALVRALAALPALRMLHTGLATVDAAAMRRLARLPLTSLELAQCPGFDDDAWQALLTMRTLERLSFADWGRTPLAAPAGTAPAWRPSRAQLAQLAALPKLTALQLRGCDLRDDEFAALPDTLVELRVQGHELSAAAFAGLRRLGRLRGLELTTARRRITLAAVVREPDDAGDAADAVADALPSLNLEWLDYRGRLTPALLRAVAGQSALARLSMASDRIADLAALATMPRLRSLTVYEAVAPGSLDLETLRPLRECRSLRELDVRAHEVDAAAVKALFGARVTVTTHSWKTVLQAK